MEIQENVIGEFLPFDHERYKMHFDIVPREILQNYQKCWLTSDYSASYLTHSKIFNKNFINSVSFIISEILQNAVKYSYNCDSRISMTIFENKNLLIIEISNFISEAQKELFHKLLEKLIFCTDIENEYIEALIRVSENIKQPVVTGIGIVTILHDFHPGVSAKFIGPDDNHRYETVVQVCVNQEEYKNEN